MAVVARIVSVKVPDIYLSMLDALVAKGLYSSRSEAIRTAIRLLLEYHDVLPSSKIVKMESVRRVVI